MDWRTRAACRTENPELFFPVGATGPAPLQEAEAKEVCRGCPVAMPCLEWAMDHENHGVWGGTSEDERRRIRRGARPVRAA
ncbi:MAG: WhiB family transcriptional regulator [Pseudonocardia sp.]|nr:WhiB family transcriptional regulator [Pseudonocardia sp.]